MNHEQLSQQVECHGESTHHVGNQPWVVGNVPALCLKNQPISAKLQHDIVMSKSFAVYGLRIWTSGHHR